MSNGFTEESLAMLVNLGGQALKSEDQYIRRCFETNPILRESASLVPGIKLVEDERHYQRIVHRALLPSFPFVPKLEYGPKEFDIALFQKALLDKNEQPIALGEMKVDRLATLNSLIPVIEADIEKLAEYPTCGQFLVVFTIVKTGGLGSWVDELLDRLNCHPKKHFEYSFDTANDPYGKIQREGWSFGIVGVLLKAVL